MILIEDNYIIHNKYHHMPDRNSSTDKNSPEKMANKGRGMQGIDKAPAEETAQSTEQFITQTQKGKNKVDGDPSKESDQPLDRQNISS
jgi:hypothetical protein